MQTILDTVQPRPGFETGPIPARAGVGLKAQHVAQILQSSPELGFFEVHAENYMGAGGMPHAQLREIRERYPLSIHGVGMSIGGENPINTDHLARFAEVVRLYGPGLVSEHLAWSTHDDVFYNDLLPLPYTSQTLARVALHVEQVQEAIGRPILIENPSTYMIFAQSTWSEADFMREIARRSGCGLLLDVNNVFVSASNHEYSPHEYIDSYPLELVEEIHLAGHATDSDDDGRPLLIDAHDREVCTDVWELYDFVLSRTGPLPSLIEWDNEVPQWATLHEEAGRVDRAIQRSTRKAHMPPRLQVATAS
ncbi:MAG: DUF692 domain-containing protein [Rhizobiaceae bacterium]